ncbi:monosaccharide-sensing protein 3 [Senna tora]|uniref:Monosaccharide-sensing protein 3 n=1 Tax=Senna tora TaxID=362788 RepID=A0A834T4R1_9FABA|nr:monosaccharide-sensing protein 3 [Senna tora]
MEGAIVSMTFLAGTFMTTFAGTASDLVGRRSMLVLSSIMFLLSGVVAFSAPNVYVVVVSRALSGVGIALAVTLTPLYISEISPPDIRGQLNTVTQFSCSFGMFLAYSLVFLLSLMASPSWRLMLGLISFPSLVYFALAMLFLPESPRWLVTKGRLLEAKKVLQRIRGTHDVSGELALLVEGLSRGGESTSVEEYIVAPANETTLIQEAAGRECIKLYGPNDDEASMVAQPVTGQLAASTGGSMISTMIMSRQGSTLTQSQSNLSQSLKDPLVTLFGVLHDNPPVDSGSGILNIPKVVSISSNMGDDNSNLHTPLMLSRQPSGIGGDRSHSHHHKNSNNNTSAMNDIGGGWKLVYKGGSNANVEQVAVQAQAQGWRGLIEPGVRRALLVGIGLQVLQQAAGINGFLYYGPQILNQAGIGDLLSSLGISSISASLLANVIISFFMLPCIGLSMKLMDIAGRRSIMLYTVPILIVCLVVLVVRDSVITNPTLNGAMTALSVVVYESVFCMGFGVIPNILCAEIFPTSVRGICISICCVSFWIATLILTSIFPSLLQLLGLTGVFSLFVVGCVVSWVFVYLKVPETKGMPLEVITEFFAIGANPGTDDLASIT